MASATVGVLRVLLTANTAEFDSAMKDASNAAKDWSKDLGSIGRQATDIGRTLTTAITLPIVGMSGAAIKMAMDFESSFAGVRKTVDATEPEFAQLAQGLRTMAKEIPVNVNELNRVAEAAGQLGIKKDDILQFTRTMADLGVTTNLTAEEAAAATAQIQNIFGAAGQDVDRFGAALVALGNAGASTEKDIIDMGLRIAGAGHQVGLTQAQVLAFASALSSVGINAEAGGSAISRVFLKINDAVAKGGADMAEFARVAGMTSEQFRTSFETDAAGATVAFIEGLARLKGEGENVNATLEGLVGKNITVKDALLRASGAGQLLHDQLKLGATAWQENTALTKEAAERYKTFESQAKLLWAQVRDLGIELGTALIPIFKDLMGVARPLVAALGDLAQWFGTLPQGVRTTFVAVGALVAALGPAIFLFGQVALGAQAIVAAFAAKGIATRALTAVMSSATGQTGLFGMSLTALGTTAGMAAAFFAGWKFGSWLGEVTGATDAVGRLSAKLGEMLGILPEGTAALYDQAQAAKTAAAELDKLGKKTEPTLSLAQDLGRAVAEMNIPMAAARTGTANLGGTVKDATKDLREFNNWLGERQMEAAAIGIEAMDKVAASFQRGLAAMVPFRAALHSTGESIRALGGSINDLISFSLRDYGEATTAARKEAEDWALKNGAVLAPSIQQVSAAALLGGETATGFMGKIKASFGQAGLDAQGLASIFAQAFTGGGGILGGFKAVATQGLGALMGMIPGVGPWLQAFSGPIVEGISKLAKKVGDLLRGIFGPSADELRGREHVAAFEDELEGALTAAQRAEAGTDAWKQTVIALRDAYMAAGRTEEEALADAKRLWESSKQSAEESLRVIEEIRRKMAALPTDHTIQIHIETPEGGVPVDPGSPAPGEGVLGGLSAGLTGMSSVIQRAGGIPFGASALGAGASSNSSSVRNNYFMIPIPGDAAGDPRKMATAFWRQLPSALELDLEGVATAFSHFMDNRMMDRPRRG